MTEMQLISQSKKLYEQILGIEFAPEEMLAFGRAVFTKTPWGALSAAGKLAMFRLTAAFFALAAPDAPAAAETALAPEVAEETGEPQPTEVSDGGGAAQAEAEVPDDRAKGTSPDRALLADQPRHSSRDVA